MEEADQEKKKTKQEEETKQEKEEVKQEKGRGDRAGLRKEAELPVRAKKKF